VRISLNDLFEVDHGFLKSFKFVERVTHVTEHCWEIRGYSKAFFIASYRRLKSLEFKKVVSQSKIDIRVFWINFESFLKTLSCFLIFIELDESISHQKMNIVKLRISLDD